MDQDRHESPHDTFPRIAAAMLQDARESIVLQEKVAHALWTCCDGDTASEGYIRLVCPRIPWPCACPVLFLAGTRVHTLGG